MYHYRPKKENNECQTDLQCTPFILNENETANVHSSRDCQTEIQLSPRTPDTELYKIIPYIDDDDIERNAIRSVNIARNRKIKLHFALPVQNSDSLSPLENDDYKYVTADELNKEVKHVKHDGNLQSTSNEESDSESSLGILKSAFKKTLKEDDSTQTDLMIAPHILNDHEKATITVNTSCQTSVTCTPRTSLTNVVPLLKNYWEHEGETRETFNKSENVLEILKEVIQDVINIHQHMFDPNYDLPMMNPVLVKIGPKNSSKDSSEWDTVSQSKTTKQTIRDVSGDGSFDNTALSDLDLSIKNKHINDLKQTPIASISTISEVTTLRSSDFTLTSTKDDYDEDDLDDIISTLKKKYTSPNDERSEKLSNIMVSQSEPTISSRMGAKAMPSMKSNNGSELESNAESFRSDELWSEKNSKRSLHKEETPPIDNTVPITSHKCEIINTNCVCSGIKIKLYLKDKFDDNNENSNRFIEMKIKPDLETVEIKRLLNISTNPELTEIYSTIPFQEIEHFLKDEIEIDSLEDIVKLFDIEDKPQPIDADISKADGLKINITMPKSTALSPQTESEEFLQSFMLTNFLLKDIENAPYPELVSKVSFPSRTCQMKNEGNTSEIQPCSCDEVYKDKLEQLKIQKPVTESESPFTAIYSRMYEDPDNLIPFDKNDFICQCKNSDKKTDFCDEHELCSNNSVINTISETCTVKTRYSITKRDSEIDIAILSKFPEDSRILRDMSSYVILPSLPVPPNSHRVGCFTSEHAKKSANDLPHQTASISYEGHIYQTDTHFVSSDSDGSDETSIHSKIIDDIKQNKLINQNQIISYEEHMYNTNGDMIPHTSQSSITNMDCICAQKLEESLRECPHCFRRIGPQYGRDQLAPNDQGYEMQYDQGYEMQNQPDFCNTKQNTTNENKRGLFSQYNYTSSMRFNQSHVSVPSSVFNQNHLVRFAVPKSEENTKNQMINDNTKKQYTEGKDVTKIVDVSNNLKKRKNDVIGEYTANMYTLRKKDPSYFMNKTNNIIASQSGTADNVNVSNNLVKNNNVISDKPNAQLKNTPINWIDTYANIIDKLAVSEENTTTNIDSSENLSLTKNNIENVDVSEENITTNIDSSGNLIETKNNKEKLDVSEENITTNIDSSGNLIETKNNTEKLDVSEENTSTSGNLTKAKNKTEKLDVSEENTTTNIDSSGNLTDTKNNTKQFDTLKENIDTLEDVRGNVQSADANDPSKYVKFIEKIYPTGKIVIGTMDADYSVATKLKDSKCNICYRDKPCPKFLCKVTDIVKNSLNDGCSKSTAEETLSLSKVTTEKEEKYKMFENNLPLDKTTKTLKNICQTGLKVKLDQISNKEQTSIPLQDTSVLNKIPVDQKDLPSKFKCQTCSKAKLNQANNKNLSIVTIQGICSICSSDDGHTERMQYNAKVSNSYTCSAICNSTNAKSGIKLEGKRSIENFQKLTKTSENVESHPKKCKSSSCSNLVKKDFHISSNLMQDQDKSSKSLTAPKTKCSTCKKSLKPTNTVQVLYAPKSNDLNCACIKSKCRQTQNIEKISCLVENKSAQNSVSNKNKCSTCQASKKRPVQYRCSHILKEVKLKLESLPNEQQSRTKIVECPQTPHNSLELNCTCSKCILSKYPNVNTATYPASKCLNLPYCSVQKIFEKNIPCSCSSSYTNEKEDNSDFNFDYLTEKINPCYMQCDQNKDTTENTKNKKQEKDMLSEQIQSPSDFKTKKNILKENTQNEVEKIINDVINDAELLSTLTVALTTEPRVQILNAPKYIYKSYSSVSNNPDLLGPDSKEIFLYNSLDDFNNFDDVGMSSAEDIDHSKNEFLLTNISNSHKHIHFKDHESNLNSKTIEGKEIKTINIYKLDGKYSVFSTERKPENSNSQNTVYILPNAIFSSLLSVPPPHFLRERTQSEIDDILQFSYIRNLHYERNPEFNVSSTIASSNHNSEEFMSIIADQNLPNMNCAITCSCSSSSPKNEEQQTDEKIAINKIDKTTSITRLQENESKAFSDTSSKTSPVGIPNSYVLFHTSSYSDKISLSSAFARKKILNSNNEKLLEDAPYRLETNPMHIMGKYITWKDLISPNLYNPIPIQNAITSLEPFINLPDEKIDVAVQTSNISFITVLPVPSLALPLTIEASTSTGNLTMEMSLISSSRYHLSENFSTIDIPLGNAITSDSSLSATNKILRKHIFQTPSATKYLKTNDSPTLTLEKSTSTRKNEATAQTEEDFAFKLHNNSSSDKKLTEEEATSKSEEFVKPSTSKLPINRTSSSVSLIRITSPYKHISFDTRPRSIIEFDEATTSKAQTNIELTSAFSTEIASPFIDSLPEILEKPQETSTNDMSSNIRLEEPSLPKLANKESYLHIPVSRDRFSTLSCSLPKVESYYSIAESNYDPTDTDTNKYELNNQEWSYPQDNIGLHYSRKFMYKDSSFSIHSNDLEHGDISVSAKNLSVQNKTLSKSELLNDDEHFKNETISTASIKILPDISSSKSPNHSRSSKYTSKTNTIYPASPYDEDHQNEINADLYEKYNHVRLKRNTQQNNELNNSPVNASTSRDLQEDTENISHEQDLKALQSENLLSRAIDAYTSYLSLKKRISSNFNVSEIELPYQQTSRNLEANNSDHYKYEEEEEINKPLEHSVRDFQSSSLTSNIEDYYSAYLKRKERISSLISMVKTNSTYSYLEHTDERDRNSIKLPYINSLNMRNSKDSKTEDFLYETERAYSKLLKHNEELSPQISVSNTYSSFDHIPKDLQRENNSAKNSLVYRYSPGSITITTDDFKRDNSISSSQNKKQVLEVSRLPSLKKINSSFKPGTYRDLRSEKFVLKTDYDSSLDSEDEGKISVLNRISHSSEIHRRKQAASPRASKNSKQSLSSYKNEDSYLKRWKKEENMSPLPSIKENDSIASGIHYYRDASKMNLKNEDSYSKVRKAKGKSYLNKMNSPYHNVGPNISRDLKSDKFIFNTRDNYSAYLMNREEISEKSSPREITPPYLQSISKNRSSRVLKSDPYSMYLKKEEAISPRRSTSKIASPSTSENRNNKDLKSNKFVSNPSSNLNPVYSSNSASNKNSATSKLSSFVRHGTTNALLSNIGDSPQLLSVEEMDSILPDIAVSSHRVLEAVQSCEQRLQPIKTALKDIKMKLKELNMPEVNGILQNEYLVDENNKTSIYLPPPPASASNRCSYRTKMTFQLRKPIKPLISVTANVNPFSIKHKYILNDADNNHNILNTNYSSVSDPPYYVQRTSMNSINPNFINQPSHSENRPLHSQRYDPDTYIERLHGPQKLVEAIQEDPYSPEDLEGRKVRDEFEQYQYLPDSYEMYYYEPQTESLNNYVVFPPIGKSSRVSVPEANSFNRTEHVFNDHNVQNMKMFTGDNSVWNEKPKK